MPIRCKHYDDDGKIIGRGCYNLSTCGYVHPSEPRWDQAERRQLASGGNKDRVGSSSQGFSSSGGPKPRSVPKGPRSLSNLGKTDVDVWSTGNHSDAHKGSSNGWGAPKPRSGEWANPPTATAAEDSWNSWKAPDSGWGTASSANNENAEPSPWATASSGWGTSSSAEKDAWGSGGKPDSNDQAWGESANTMATTNDNTLAAGDQNPITGWGAASAGWGSAQAEQSNTDVEMANAEPSTSGWGNLGSTMAPPPPPTDLPPTPPVSGGFKPPLRINPLERKSPPAEPNVRNVFRGLPKNPLKRKYEEPSTPVSPCTTIPTASSSLPRPHTDAAINAVKERLRAEDDESIGGRSSSLVPSQGSSSDGWESKKRKESTAVSKLKRNEVTKVWHNHIKFTQRALNARRKLEEAEANLTQCDRMVRSERFGSVGSSARDVLEGHRTAYFLEVEHRRKAYEDALAELVKDDERFDIPPHVLLRSGEETNRKKDLAEMKRYLESAQNWMEATQGDIETLREAREQVQRESTAVAGPSTNSITDPGPSAQINEPTTEAASRNRKTSPKVLKRLDRLEELLANIETEQETLTANMEERTKDAVEAAVEDLERPNNDDEMDEDNAEGTGQSNAQVLDELEVELKTVKEDAADVKQIAIDTHEAVKKSNEGLQDFTSIAEELRAKEGELSNDLSAVRSDREQLSRVLEEAKQQQAEMKAAIEAAEQRYKETVSASAVTPAALAEAILAPLIASVKQSILPEVEKVGEVLLEDVEKKVAQLNADVVGTVWKKIEQPLEAAKRMAQGSLKGRGRGPSISTTPRVPPFPYLVASGAGSQPSTSNVTQ